MQFFNVKVLDKNGFNVIAGQEIYIGDLDSDDYLFSNHSIETFIKRFEKKPFLGAVYSDSHFCNGDGGGGGGCFIATAVYNSPTGSHVKILREFRNHFLLTNSVGKAFVRLYYTYSPPLADFIADHHTLRAVVRWGLLTIVGVSLISLNLGPIPTLAFILLFLSFISTATLVRKRHLR